MSTGVQRLLTPINKGIDRISESGQHTYLVLKSASGLTSSNTMLPLSIAFMAWKSSSVIRGTLYRQTTFRQNCLLYCLWKQTLGLLVYLDAGCGIREWQGGCIQFCKTTLCMYVNVAGAVSGDAHCSALCLCMCHTTWLSHPRIFDFFHCFLPSFSFFIRGSTFYPKAFPACLLNNLRMTSGLLQSVHMCAAVRVIFICVCLPAVA